MRPNDKISVEMPELISARLRPACPDIPEAEFQRLVQDVARVKLKYDYDRFATSSGRTSVPNTSAVVLE
jgi:hypothetical protein